MRAALITIISMIVGLIVYSIFSTFSKKRLILIGIFSAVLIILIITYTHFQNKEGKKEADLIAVFLRGETLICNDIMINKNDFELNYGTLSFIGKRGSPHFNSIFLLKDCRN